MFHFDLDDDCFLLCVFSAYTGLFHSHFYILVHITVLTLARHKTVLLFGCSQSSEQSGPGERGRERNEEGKPCEEKSVSSHSNNYCDFTNHICSKFICGIATYTANTENPRTGFIKFQMFHAAWFCATFNLYPQVWQNCPSVGLSSCITLINYYHTILKAQKVTGG